VLIFECAAHGGVHFCERRREGVCGAKNLKRR